VEKCVEGVDGGSGSGSGSDTVFFSSIFVSLDGIYSKVVA
jgi:hypothetical protein